MSFRKSAIMLSFAAAMSLLNTTAFAIDMSSSQVIKTTGKVAVKKVNSPDFKKLNSNLKLAGALKKLNGGDKVRTFNNSTADLVLKDTCELTVTEQSIFEVPQVLTKQDLKTLVAQQGSVLFKVVKGSNFQVQTSDVICGVKGTIFGVKIFDNLDTILETPGLQLGFYRYGGTVVDVYDGEVEVLDKITNQKHSVARNERYSSSDKIPGILKGKQILDVSKSLFNVNTSKADTVISNIGFGISSINKWKGQKFRANFSQYPILDSEKAFTNQFSDVYLGNGMFAAGMAAFGSKSLIVEPNESGLVITQGNGLIKMNSFKDNLDKKNELLINVYDYGNYTITAIRYTILDKRDRTLQPLCWRETGTLNQPQLLPFSGHDVCYVYDKTSNRGYWTPAGPANVFFNDLIAYNYNSLNNLRNEKSRINHQNERQKREVIRDGVRRYGKIGLPF